MKTLLIFLLIGAASNMIAQEFRGGELWFKHIDDNKYDVYVDVYTKDAGSSTKPFLRLVSVSNPDTAFLILDTLLIDNISLSRYKTTFVFSGEGDWPILVIDTFYLPGVKNFGASNNDVFKIRGFVNVLNYLLFQLNTPALFANYQTDYTFDNGVFLFDSRAEDVEGDTMFYRRKNYNNFGYEYTFPAASDTFSCDFLNGMVTWDKPLEPGKYLIGVEFYEYHYTGHYLYHGARDMIIEVTEEDIVSNSKEPKKEEPLFTLSPNPTTAHVTIKNLQSKPYSLIIHNAAGQKLMALPEGNEETRTLDVSSFPKGVYWVEFVTREGVVVEKLVVQ